jgi:signal transduction histidine kinase
MLSGIVHEIGTPMMVISGQLELIVSNIEDTNPQRDYLTCCAEKGIDMIDKVKAITRSVRSLSRDAGGDPFFTVSLSEIFEDFKLFVDDRAFKERVQIKTSDHDAKVFCRKVQIVQVLTILVNNSMDAVAYQAQ